MRPLGLYPPAIRKMYLWECAVELGLDEVDESGPANTATGLHQEPVFATKTGGLGFGAVKLDTAGVVDG